MWSFLIILSFFVIIQHLFLCSACLFGHCHFLWSYLCLFLLLLCDFQTRNINKSILKEPPPLPPDLLSPGSNPFMKLFLCSVFFSLLFSPPLHREVKGHFQSNSSDPNSLLYAQRHYLINPELFKGDFHRSYTNYVWSLLQLWLCEDKWTLIMSSDFWQKSCATNWSSDHQMFNTWTSSL